MGMSCVVSYDCYKGGQVNLRYLAGRLWCCYRTISYIRNIHRAGCPPGESWIIRISCTKVGVVNACTRHLENVGYWVQTYCAFSETLMSQGSVTRLMIYSQRL